MREYIVVFEDADTKEFDNYEDALECAKAEGAIMIYLRVGTQFGAVWMKEE